MVSLVGVIDPYRICHYITTAAAAATPTILTEVVNPLTGAVLGSHTYTVTAP